MGYWHDDTRTTWSTPTCPSSWTCPGDTATASWNTSAGPPLPGGCAPGLENYRRYFQSGYARRDHCGDLPLVPFVFENENDEDAFQDAASYIDQAPFASSNLETIAQRGILV